MGQNWIRYTYLGTKLKQKDICGDQIEINTMTSNSDTDTWHWQCHVYTQGLDTWHFKFFLKKILKKIWKLKKKLNFFLKKIKKTTDWHVARWLTALVNSVWKEPNWSNFQKLGCNWHFFKTGYLFDTLAPNWVLYD